MFQEEQEQVPAAYLVIQRGPKAGKRIDLWKECTSIGRSLDSDIFLEDVTVHRIQASILLTPAGYMLRDDHGSGDSLVNGQPVKEQLLKDGDQLGFGNSLLTFFAHEGTRPFQLASSRGRERLIGKAPEPGTGVIAKLDMAGTQGTIRSFELLPQMTIGRSRDCNIFLEDLAVSRLHATIHELPDGGFELVDHRSATGTFVNGMRITRYALIEGDVVQIGSSRLTFRRSRI